MDAPASTPLSQQLPGSLCNWPPRMQLGLAFVLGILAILLGQHALQRVAVPARPTETAPVYLININSANASELAQLPGFGTVLAERIVAHRERAAFASIEQLEEVPGIGPGLLARVRSQITPGDNLQPASPAPGRPSSRKAVPASPIDLNNARKEELMQLPGIGPKLAERIIADRAATGPFHRVADVTRIKGIKSRMLEKIKPHVYVGSQRNDE